MKILVLNCGSSTVKYQLLEMPAGDVLAKGNVERIGESEGILTHKTADGKKLSSMKSSRPMRTGCVASLISSKTASSRTSAKSKPSATASCMAVKN